MDEFQLVPLLQLGATTDRANMIVDLANEGIRENTLREKERREEIGDLAKEGIPNPDLMWDTARYFRMAGFLNKAFQVIPFLCLFESMLILVMQSMLYLHLRVWHATKPSMTRSITAFMRLYDSLLLLLITNSPSARLIEFLGV